MVRSIVREMLDWLVPPRSTERIVRALTLTTLHELAADGTLPYHDPRITALVWELKYYGTIRASKLAGAFVSEQLLALASDELGQPILVPLPMHPSRRSARGHNQTELLCQEALRHLGGAYRYEPYTLKRVVDTPAQQGLPRAMRLTNVVNAMTADRSAVEGRVCVVVDDVTTTGATLKEAKRALTHAGARAVHCVALAQS